MKTIAILNLKGGTAKTVTAATMARCLSAEHDKQVVLIDADQQGNLSQYFGVTDTSQCGNTWTLLTDGAGYWPDFVTPAGWNLDLIPSGMELARADLPNSGARVTQIEEMRTVLAVDAVDFLIIDLPPSLGVATQAALLAAESGLPVFRTLIRMSPPVPKSIAARESVLTFSPQCGASKDYRAFVREYLEGGEKRGL